MLINTMHFIDFINYIHDDLSLYSLQRQLKTLPDSAACIMLRLCPGIGEIQHLLLYLREAD